MVIIKAIYVRRDNTATVGLVKSMTNELNEKIDQAFKSIPEGERTVNKKAELGLEKDIQAAKNLRDFKLKGKVDSVVIKELNREIAIANKVLNNSRATINEVINTDEAINEAYNKAAGYLNVEVPEEVEEKPAIDEIIEEQTDELFESDSQQEPTAEEETVEEIEEFVELEEIDE